MAKTGLLIVTNPAKVINAIPHVQKYFLNKLYIQYLPDRLSRLLAPTAAAKFPSPPVYSRTVIQIYSQSLGNHNLDITVLLAHLKDPLHSVIRTRRPIDVVFFDQVFNGEEVNTIMKTCISNTNSECKVISLSESEEVHDESLQPQKDEVGMYDNVVLGGTFDRLHAGHKILLSEAVLRCRKRLTVGVTDETMLKSKYLSELIEPCEFRIFRVLEFLQDIDPNIQYDVVPISDPFGPTKDDPDLEMIVVSEETRRGGEKVNEVRIQRSLKPLKIHSVDLLVTQSKQEQEEEDKVSSGNLRLRVLGTRLFTPTPKTELPRYPYIIGLTGGIASGKSSVGRRLAELGAGIVYCDALAHELYQKGQPLQKALVEKFGEKIIGKDGEVDRKVLGSIVFGNKDLLQALNDIVWPALLQRTKQEIATLHAAGRRVVVIEAAILRLAGWQNHCHEVWVCIIPPEEAVRRLKERNNLSEEDAWARLSSQPSNAEQIEGAVTVLSTLWTYDFTQRQVARAWKYLHEYLEEQNSSTNKL